MQIYMTLSSLSFWQTIDNAKKVITKNAAQLIKIRQCINKKEERQGKKPLKITKVFGFVKQHYINHMMN